MKIVFATNNKYKATEIRSILPEGMHIITLEEANILEEIPEPFDTIEENAAAKSRFIKDKYGLDCMAEDTGLEVEALNGEPGVRSARYAEGEDNYQDNIEKLLHELEHKTNRRARFKTIISLRVGAQTFSFEGLCPGAIMHERKGNNGFGYDAVFVPDGATKTFAEMELQEKNIYSHRKKATQQLLNHLNNYGKN